MTTSERAAETARDRLVEAGAVSSRGGGSCRTPRTRGTVRRPGLPHRDEEQDGEAR